MSSLLAHIEEAKAAISARTAPEPRIGLILGSGLGDLAHEVENATTIPFDEIPHFPVSTVEGHAGRLVLGMLCGVPVVAMQGRLHYYEGYTMQQITLPVRVMRALGCDTVIITCACGGLNPNFRAGDMMLISDFINLMGEDPLRGPNDSSLGPRFPAMVGALSPDLIQLAERVGADLGIPLQKGVYSPISGPSYNTPAELRMLQILGSDAVGMSTVPEIIVARHMGMNVLGIACVTDMALPDHPVVLTHEQVMETANRTKPLFTGLVKGVLERMPR